MQLRFGNFYFPANQVTVETEIQHLLSDAKIVYGYRNLFRIRGYLLLDDSSLTGAAAQKRLSQLSLNMEIALRIPGQDMTLLCDDGSPSYTNFSSSQSYSGVIITAGPNFSPIQQNDYCTQRQFSIAGYVEYASSPVNIVTSFRESLTFSGGGPLRIAKRAINGPPQIQMPYLQTEYQVTQAGQAEALRGYPVIPPPLFPFAMVDNGAFRNTSPVRNGINYEKWGVTWEYRFVSAIPLVGLPNLWTTA